MAAEVEKCRKNMFWWRFKRKFLFLRCLYIITSILEHSNAHFITHPLIFDLRPDIILLPRGTPARPAHHPEGPVREAVNPPGLWIMITGLVLQLTLVHALRGGTL